MVQCSMPVDVVGHQFCLVLYLALYTPHQVFLEMVSTPMIALATVFMLEAVAVEELDTHLMVMIRELATFSALAMVLIKLDSKLNLCKLYMSLTKS